MCYGTGTRCEIWCYKLLDGWQCSLAKDMVSTAEEFHLLEGGVVLLGVSLSGNLNDAFSAYINMVRSRTAPKSRTESGTVAAYNGVSARTTNNSTNSLYFRVGAWVCRHPRQPIFETKNGRLNMKNDGQAIHWPNFPLGKILRAFLRLELLTNRPLPLVCFNHYPIPIRKFLYGNRQQGQGSF
jgi:hypothetical protein